MGSTDPICYTLILMRYHWQSWRKKTGAWAPVQLQISLGLPVSQFRFVFAVHNGFVGLLHQLAGDGTCGHRTTNVQRGTAHVDQRFNRNQQGDQGYRQAHRWQYNQRSKGRTTAHTGNTG